MITRNDETTAVTLSDLFPTIQHLPRADKLRLMQFLVMNLAEDEGIPLLTPNAEYPIWTPLNAFAAAETLWHMLETHKTTP